MSAARFRLKRFNVDDAHDPPACVEAPEVTEWMQGWGSIEGDAPPPPITQRSSAKASSTRRCTDLRSPSSAHSAASRSVSDARPASSEPSSPPGKRPWITVRGIYGGVPTQVFDRGRTLAAACLTGDCRTR